jgi:Domain of unknown function (DUF6398)
MKNKDEKVNIENRKRIIIDHIKSFCDLKLNDEYFELSIKLVDTLGRKRVIPFMTGKTEIWGSAIIHAIGSVNFLFDNSSMPYIKVNEISNFFNVNQSTMTSKSKSIRDLLKMTIFDENFSLKQVKENDPFSKLVVVDGLIVPFNSLPGHLQELVKKTRKEGKDISFTAEQTDKF